MMFQGSDDISFTRNSRVDPGYDEAKLEARLIIDMNKLLTATGIAAKKIRSLSELARVASSIFVAFFEHVYHTRIDEVIREPKTREDYEYNAQLVVDRLGEQINYDLSYITGSQIVDGDVTALANLVDIFTRILAINTTRSMRSTSTIESEESMFDEIKPRYKRPQSPNAVSRSFGSISTKESLSPPRKDTKRSPSRFSSSSKKYDDLVRHSLEKAEDRLKQEIEQHEATMRRKNMLLWKQAKLQQINKRKSDKSTKILQRKKVIDMKHSQDSYKLKCDNEETLLIRRVYHALLREMLRLRNEEKSQEKQFTKIKLQELEIQLESVQRIFRERLDVVKDFESTPRYPLEAIKQGRAAFHNIEDQYEDLLHNEENWLEQCRDKQLCNKRRQYRNLLSLLRAEKWSESLREY